ncbi:MAG: hypothetical protein JRI25_23905, partial [Deltaproteobacteria bacterium]|nr:hypothetical protein [Deltaproteobacteria bacterium]
DGREWEQVEVPAPDDPYTTEQMSQVVAVGSGLIAHGYVQSIHGSALWLSPDGYRWQRVPASALGDPEDDAEIKAMVAGGPGVVAVGSVVHPDGGPRVGAIWVSETGWSWERIAHDGAVFGDPQSVMGWADGEISEVVVFDPGVVALGHINGEMSLLRSADGYQWERVPLGPAPFGDLAWRIGDIAAGGPGLVAVGGIADPTEGEWASDAAIWVSSDGIAWDRVPHSERLFGGPECQGIKTLVVGGPGLVAFGATDLCSLDDVPEGTNRVWITADGYTWELVPHDDYLFGDGSLGWQQAINDAVVHDGRIIAVGQWSRLTLIDESAPPRHNNVDDLSWGGRVWIATPIDD